MVDEMSHEVVVEPEGEGHSKTVIEVESNPQVSKLANSLPNNVCVPSPMVGISFKSAESVKTFYREYGISKGFDIKTRNSKKDRDQQQRYFILSCAREGRHVNSASSSLKKQPSTKVECQAKITVTLKDGQWYIMTFTEEHCHSLSPSKSRLFHGNKKIDLHVQRKLQINDEAGVRVNKSYRSLICDAGGHENLSFVERDVRNFVARERRSLGKVGDGKALLSYFARMTECNREFFYDIDLDDDFRVKNIFWADARSRAAYEYFGDVVSFDTTYLTNKYDMSFAPFVGINHHSQSILLGCDLLSAEDTETFVWLFKTWLRCMSFKVPHGIVTDQCKAMQNAIAIVFPETRHRWCLWHIMKKLPEKLKGYAEYTKIKSLLATVVYESISVDEFEINWNLMINQFELSNNDWLANLFTERQRWVPCFLKCFFWAGMSTTHRSESMNAFFDGYINSTTTLQDFVKQYDNALKDKAEKEQNADFRSLTTTIPCGSQSMIERQFQFEYTHAKFQEIQIEFQGKMNCFVVKTVTDNTQSCYEVMEEKIVAEKSREVIYRVQFFPDVHHVSCTCCLFEFMGIIYRHALLVLAVQRVKTIPSKYIMSRWSKNIKRRHAFIKTINDPKCVQPRMERFDSLCKKFYKVAEIVADSKQQSDLLQQTLDSFMLTIEELPHNTNNQSEVVVDESVQIRIEDSEKQSSAASISMINSPRHVPRKGRPRTNRRMSTFEKVTKQKKRTANKNKSSAFDGKDNNVGGSNEVTRKSVEVQTTVNVTCEGNSTEGPILVCFNQKIKFNIC